MSSKRKTGGRPRSQPRIVGVRRQPVSSAFAARIERAVEREMSRYGASRSFVIAVAVAHALGVELDKDEEY